MDPDQDESESLVGASLDSILSAHDAAEGDPGSAMWEAVAGTDRVVRQSIQVPFEFPIHYTRDLFAPEHGLLGEVLRRDRDGVSRRVLVFVDTGVAECWPNLNGLVSRALRAVEGIELVAKPYPIPGGEQAKDGWRVVQTVTRLAAQHRIDRQSYILAIGGGAMLDAVGLGAALVHRGVRLIRVPTTVLAQNDAGIGVKNGVNLLGQKNFLGVFAPPYAVLCDMAFLRTLEDRAWRDGLAEALKVAAIKDASFVDFLEAHAVELAARNQGLMEAVVYQCGKLHAEHTGTAGDPFEMGASRPLDFGHWLAHWMESHTQGAVSHGEAVAINLAIDAAYAEALGHLEPGQGGRLRSILARMGFDLWHESLAETDGEGALRAYAGLDMFREHLGGKLHITLPAPLGSRIEVNEIDRDRMAAAIQSLRPDS